MAKLTILHFLKLEKREKPIVKTRNSAFFYLFPCYDYQFGNGL